MAERYPPVNDLGLVIPPEFEDCDSDGCHLEARGEDCFTSRHHVYWPRRNWSEGLMKKFRERPENVLPSPRCQHDTYHWTYTIADKPPTPIMERFVEESLVLQRLGVLSRSLAQQLAAFPDPEAMDSRRFEIVENKRERQHELALQVVRFEVLPARFGVQALANYGLDELLEPIMLDEVVMHTTAA